MFGGTACGEAAISCVLFLSIILVVDGALSAALKRVDQARLVADGMKRALNFLLIEWTPPSEFSGPPTDVLSRTWERC